MTTTEETQTKPLWIGIEESLLGLNPENLSGEAKEAAVQKIISDLDDAGFNVSTSGGRIMQLRWAIDDMLEAGRPLMKDFNAAIAALTLEDVLEPYSATTRLIDNLSETWKDLKKAERRPDIIGIVQEARLDLLVKKQKNCLKMKVSDTSLENRWNAR